MSRAGVARPRGTVADLSPVAMISVLQQLAEHTGRALPGHRVPWREPGCGGDGEPERVTTVGAASVFMFDQQPIS
jgi:hypothetical protein